MTIVQRAPAPAPVAPPTRTGSAAGVAATCRRSAGRPIVQRMSRCFLVSVGTTVLSAVVLVALALGAGVPAGSANVVAVCCGIAPSYFANRHWVWRRSGRSDLVHEVLPFWMLSIVGLVVSTMAVSLVASAGVHWSTSLRAVALPLANLSVFGALWLVQFALLDKVLFRVVPNEPISPNGSVSPNGSATKEFTA